MKQRKSPRQAGLRVGRERLLAGAIAAGGCVAAFASTQVVLAQEPEHGDGVTQINRSVVATGKDGRFGPWKVETSQTPDGTPCVDIVFDAPPGGKNAPAPGSVGGCGSTVLEQIGQVSESTIGSFYFGGVSEKAATVVIKDGGRDIAKLNAIRGADGRKYVAGSVGGKTEQFEAHAADAAGAALGRVDPKSVADRAGRSN